MKPAVRVARIEKSFPGACVGARALLFQPLGQAGQTTLKVGVNSSPNAVTPSMPKNIAVPSAACPSSVPRPGRHPEWQGAKHLKRTYSIANINIGSHVRIFYGYTNLSK
jgi:hypothetical protein